MAVRQRIVAGVAATLTWQAVDQDGEPSDPGTTTVAVVRADGSTVHAAGTATTATGTARTVALTAAQNASPDQYTTTWTGATASGQTTIDAAGGVYFTVAALRAAHPAVNNEAAYPAATIIAKRREVEAKFERGGMPAFVPRFAVVAPSNGKVAQRGVRYVRWVELDDEDGTIISSGLDDYTTVTVAGVNCSASVARVGLVHGYDVPPADVDAAAMLYCRHLLTSHAAQVDMRPLATINPDGSRDTFATPGTGSWVTGIPEVDEVLKGYSLPRRVGTIHATGWWSR